MNSNQRAISGTYFNKSVGVNVLWDKFDMVQLLIHIKKIYLFCEYLLN